MSRLFLTNIDLNTNELQNAVIQNLSSAPLSGNKEGRIYYDVTNKALYLYTDGQWKPVASGGAAASSIELTGDVTGTATVDPTTGKLTVDTTVDSSFVTLDGTQTLKNKTLQGTTYLKSAGGAGGTGVHFSVDNNGQLTLSSDWDTTLHAGNDLNLTTSNGDIVLSPDGNAYVGGKDSSQRIATIYDLTNATLNIQGTTNQVNVDDQAGITTISLPDTIYKPTTFSIGYQDGFDITFSDNGNTYLNQTTGDGTVHVLGTFTVDYGLTNNPEYSAFQVDPGGAVTQVRNVLAINNDSDNNFFVVNGNSQTISLYDPADTNNTILTISNNGNTALIAANSGLLNLQSGSGAINLLPDNGRTVFSENIQITQDGYVYANNTDLTLGADTSNVNVEGTLVTDSIRAYGTDTLYVSADNIVLNTNVEVGGSGTNGTFVVKDSNSTSVFSVDASTQEAGFSGNVTVGGDLNVTGTLNAVNRTEINIEDNTIRLNTGFSGAPTADAGIIVERGTANDTAIIWNETADQWTISNDGDHYFGIARKFSANVGNASATSFDVVHNMGTRDVTVQVYTNSSTYDVVETDILMKDANTVTIAFADAPAVNAYRVVVVG